MSVSRAPWTDCGFEVAAHAECPLCGHRPTEREGSTGAIRALFGDWGRRQAVPEED